MAGNARHVVNMANSIVGVSILSMPYCFKEAGMLQCILLLLLSGFITKKTCMFLVRSAIMARRRSYEFLAFHVFGVSGKLFVEMCMIFFLIGICISFHVVMGDLAPAIVARFLEVDNSPSLRCTLLIGIVLLVILPLCLLRNLDSLASMSACSIGFYFFLITVILWHAFPKLWDGSWYLTAELWRPAGAFQVLPICCLALACQSNVFEIYDSVPDPDVPKMRSVVNGAVNLCSALYIIVGFLGYVAFVDKDLSGNVIMNFPSSNLTEGIKIFFTVSLAISFPLMIFPCRTSIHSLLYRRSNPSSYDLVGNYMPEARFKGITLGILLTSLVVGILIPNIELVLGLLGSTLGMLIALILPSLLFIKVNSKSSTERLLAQGIMLMGLIFIVTGTYSNIAHINEVQTAPKAIPTENLPKVNLESKIAQVEDIAKPAVAASQSADNSVTRKEPVAPEPPPEEVEKKEILAEKGVEHEEVEIKQKEEQPPVNEDGKIDKALDMKDDNLRKTLELKDEKNLGDTLHPDAIQKEEKENREEGDNEKKLQVDQLEKKQAELLEKIEEQQQEQKKILAEQKEILKELKDHKNKQDEDAKRKNLEVRENDVANPPNQPSADDILGKPIEHEKLVVQVQEQGEQVIPQDLKSSLLKDNSKSVPAFVAPKANSAFENGQQLPNKLDEPVYKNLPVSSGKQVPKLEQGALTGQHDIPVVRNVILKDEPYVNSHLVNDGKQSPNIANPAPSDSKVYDRAPMPNAGSQTVIEGSQLRVASNNRAPINEAPNNQPTNIENHPIYVKSNNIVPSGSPDQVNKIGAVSNADLSLLPEKYAKIPSQSEGKHAENVGGEFVPSENNNNIVKGSVKSDGAVPKVIPGVADGGQSRQTNPKPLASEALNEQQKKQIRPLRKVPVIKNYVQEEERLQGLQGPDLKNKKKSSNKFMTSNSQNKDIEGIQKEKINKGHDEERRKRQVEVNADLHFPEIDLLKDGIKRDIGDFAYDTRHLLWIKQRRKKKHSKKRYDYQYWDET